MGKESRFNGIVNGKELASEAILGTSCRGTIIDGVDDSIRLT